MTIRSLLSILADGQFHSGQELGAELKVSRSAIWKQMRKLEDFGIEIYSVKGRGYRLPGGLDLLDEERFRQELDDVVGTQLSGQCFELSIPSTNMLAMQQLHQNGGHGRLYVAEQQTAGRGRRGRHWVSPFARNLYFSLVWRFPQGAASLEGLSLAVGLGLVRGLRRLGLEGAELKWPNDLLWQGRKLAGILLEMNGEASGDCQVVSGVGLNIAMPDELAADIGQPWVDLRQICGQTPSRTEVLAALVNELVPVMEAFSRDGFEPFRDEWHALDAYRDQRVSLSFGLNAVEGVCRGVSESGALMLETASGVESFHGGEVSLRRLS
ncbi:bifunctional ligase/repressor BirA [Marinobacterium nitratireducens]|uniref:Bifunctional ligase/repressor BirA n=1 Tax=Marinobacterium nitratireducens TaxID=518897 RepID=A0A918DXZ4_9GAMM|nr:bifunctional biotin--[acetyl-CoA-carboxylase] ligase/biotin operon repressor BirA [Marinobacterium nitratireducens]GGO87690.1 bifunctional ligase/repressor BirA [Marinobacterium nitratireducens]